MSCISARSCARSILSILHIDDTLGWIASFSEIATSRDGHGFHTVSWVSHHLNTAARGVLFGREGGGEVARLHEDPWTQSMFPLRRGVERRCAPHTTSKHENRSGPLFLIPPTLRLGTSTPPGQPIPRLRATLRLVRLRAYRHPRVSRVFTTSAARSTFELQL